jgi:hypothetical protein
MDDDFARVARPAGFHVAALRLAVAFDVHADTVREFAPGLMDSWMVGLLGSAPTRIIHLAINPVIH